MRGGRFIAVLAGAVLLAVPASADIGDIEREVSKTRATERLNGGTLVLKAEQVSDTRIRARVSFRFRSKAATKLEFRFFPCRDARCEPELANSTATVGRRGKFHARYADHLAVERESDTSETACVLAQVIDAGRNASQRPTRIPLANGELGLVTCFDVGPAVAAAARR